MNTQADILTYIDASVSLIEKQASDIADLSSQVASLTEANELLAIGQKQASTEVIVPKEIVISEEDQALFKQAGFTQEDVNSSETDLVALLRKQANTAIDNRCLAMGTMSQETAKPISSSKAAWERVIEVSAGRH